MSASPSILTFFTALGDDEFVLGHRDSEWCAFAPMIEEDVAFASIAQDEMGHARLYYELAASMGGPSPNELAFFRSPDAFRNAVLVERQNADWAYTVARHLTYDTYDDLLTDSLTDSSLRPLADIAALVRREERYHLEHQRIWARELAFGTEESRARIQVGLARALAEAAGLFETTEWHREAKAEGILPKLPEELLGPFTKAMGDLVALFGMMLPPVLPDGGLGGRDGLHSDDLASAALTWQEVYRLDPKATW